jgi:hypothetical protein
MRKLAATTLASLLILSLYGCSESPPPSAPAGSPVAAAEGPVASNKKNSKKPKRRPKVEAITKQDKMVKPFAD